MLSGGLEKSRINSSVKEDAPASQLIELRNCSSLEIFVFVPSTDPGNPLPPPIFERVLGDGIAF